MAGGPRGNKGLGLAKDPSCLLDPDALPLPQRPAACHRKRGTFSRHSEAHNLHFFLDKLEQNANSVGIRSMEVGEWSFNLREGSEVS